MGNFSGLLYSYNLVTKMRKEETKDMKVVPCCRVSIMLLLIMIIAIYRSIIQNGNLAFLSYKHYMRIDASSDSHDIMNAE